MSSFFLDESTAKRYMLGIAFTHGDTNYTAAGATAETFKVLGFKEVVVQPRPDDRLYIVNSHPLDDGSWDVQPRDLDQLKKGAVAQAKSTAASLLAPTDWMIIRSQETGDAVDADVLAYRAAVREESNLFEQAVMAVDSLDEFSAMEPNWPQQAVELEQ